MANLSSYLTISSSTYSNPTMTCGMSSNGIWIKIDISNYDNLEFKNKAFDAWNSYVLIGGNKVDLTIKDIQSKYVHFEIPLTTADIGKSIAFKSWSGKNDFLCIQAKTNTDTSINYKITTSASKVPGEWFNSAPMINGSSVSTNYKLNPYEKNTPFSYSYTVNDTDADDVLVVKEYLDGNVIRTINNAVRNATYTITIDKDTLYGLSESGVHTISISVSDGRSETTNNYKFIRTNLVPVITVSSGISNTYQFNANSPSVTYQAYDPEGEEITMSILVDDIVVEEPTVISQNTNITSSISHDNWILIKNGVHKFTLLIEDVQGGQVKQDYNFIKNETVIDFQFKEPVETEVALQKYYNIVSKLNVDSSSMQVLVTNNGYDTNPTWETMTTTPHVFSNKTKTADKWGFNVRIIITRGTEVGDMKVYGIGGSLI